MRFFAVSDVHGHFEELIKALDEAGFDKNNKCHMIVCCGDCFDRGSENRSILEFFSSLERKILIRGNHEDSLISAIERRHIDQIDVHNGLDTTVSELFGSENIDRHGRLDLSKRADTVREIYDFIGSMYDYFETDTHIFTHAWLPFTDDGEYARLIPDRKYAPFRAWSSARFNEWFTAYKKGLTVSGKTIVCGHRAAYNAHCIDPSRSPEDVSAFLAPGIAALDAATVRTHRINVYVFEDTMPESKLHFMKLNKHPFDLIKAGSKKVELRLLDEKRSTLSIGDKICFTCTDTSEEMKVQVRIVGLHKYTSFSELARDFSPSELGCTLSEIEQIDRKMESIYSLDRTAKHGALAIRISHIL